MATGRGWKRLAPRPGVLFIVVALLMFSCLLLVHGLARSQVGVDATGAVPTEEAHDEVPPAITDGGPVVDARGATPVSARMPAKTISLTFDDGPDPVWTPQVLEVLRRHHVPATFFVVGSMAAQHPQLLRDIRDAGSEVGLHTFTHPDLSAASDVRIDRELTETQLVLAGALGESSYLLRPPYSSTADAVDNDALRSFRTAGADGYVTVLSDTDSEDWQRPGVDAIVANSIPANGAGGVVLLHDAGGDRSQTVAALDRLIPQLQAQGYRFTTPETAVGLPADNRPVSTAHHLLGATLIGLVAVAGVVVDALTWLLLVVGVLVVLRLVLMLVVAVRHHRQRHRPDFSWGPRVTEPVSVIVPAYNEKENIAATVRSLVASEHPVEVLVVDDGSTDGTAEIVEALRLPNVRVIRQANGGKPAALNAGIAHARHELIVMIDGDTVFEPATVGRLVQPFADPSVGAVAGNAKVAQPVSGGLISRWQHIEYVMGFNLDRRVYDVLRCMPTIPGAVGAFRRSVLLRGRRGQRRHARRGHRPHHGDLPQRLARGVRGAGAGLDRGARDPRPALAPALPLELRDDAVDVEAPPRGARDRRVRPLRPGRPGAPRGVPGAAAAARAAGRHLPDLRAAVPRPGDDADRVVVGAGDPARRRGDRLPARARAAARALAPAAAADRLPAADVRGADPVDGHGRRRHPAGVAEAAPRRRAGGPAAGSAGAGDDGDPARAARGAQPAVTRVVGATPVTSAGGAGP